MRRAFALRVAPDSDFDTGKVAGWVEEVDTGREVRFRSVSGLLEFLSKSLKEGPPSERKGMSRRDTREDTIPKRTRLRRGVAEQG